MPTQQVQAWIKKYEKEHGKKPSGTQIQAAQANIYKRAASERQRKSNMKIKGSY